MRGDVPGDAHPEPWRRRLYLPAYRVSAAARYTGLHPRTISRWHGSDGALSRKGKGEALSYLQLIEAAVVAAFRHKGVPLKSIRTARDFAATQLECEFPFAQLEFARAGREILLNLEDVPRAQAEGLVAVSKWGQRAWKDFLPEFEYEKDLAVRWHVRGKESPILIDPRVSFGAPAVRGVPTWAIKGRKQAGETLDEIGETFDLEPDDVLAALAFEDVAA